MSFTRIVILSYAGPYIVQSSFAYSDGELSFILNLCDDEFTLSVGDKFVSDDITYTVKELSDNKTSVTLSTAVNADGNVTVPGTMTGYSADGVKIASQSDVSLSAPLDDAKKKVTTNQGRIYDGCIDDIQAFVKDNMKDINPDTKSESTVENRCSQFLIKKSLAYLINIIQIVSLLQMSY